MSKAILIMGPPGAGKGTQAKLIADKLGYVNFDTGKYLEAILYDPKNRNNKRIQRERKTFERGSLNSPDWVLQQVTNAVKRFASAKLGMVFSGSPRTSYEAFGDRKTKGLMAILEKHYGKQNITAITLTIPERESVRRNTQRLVCSVCGLPALSAATKKGIKNCVLCGGPLRKRTLDTKKAMKERLQEFRNRTMPIIKALKKRNYRVIAIDGARAPYKVSAAMYARLNKL